MRRAVGRPTQDGHDDFADTHAVVLGGAGFLGSHLTDELVASGAVVTVVDNHITSDGLRNLTHLVGHPRLRYLRQDICDGIDLRRAGGPAGVDYIVNMASPASPVDYLEHPIATLRAGSQGTHNALDLAARTGATMLQASTSEVYGDPLVSPQPETYLGNVSSIGPRSVYDEAKRFSEAIVMSFHREYGVDIRLPRIFNTFGPRMRLRDGRAVPAFFQAALNGQPLPVHGDGSQTRSLCYVSDLVEGLLRLLVSDYVGPVNIGNPHEVTVLDLARRVQATVGRHPGVEFLPRPTDDPSRRCPDTSVAERELSWQATVPLDEGLVATAAYFAQAR